MRVQAPPNTKANSEQRQTVSDINLQTTQKSSTADGQLTPGNQAGVEDAFPRDGKIKFTALSPTQTHSPYECSAYDHTDTNLSRRTIRNRPQTSHLNNEPREACPQPIPIPVKISIPVPVSVSSDAKQERITQTPPP